MTTTTIIRVQPDELMATAKREATARGLKPIQGKGRLSDYRDAEWIGLVEPSETSAQAAKVIVAALRQ